MEVIIGLATHAVRDWGMDVDTLILRYEWYIDMVLFGRYDGLRGSRI